MYYIKSIPWKQIESKGARLAGSTKLHLLLENAVDCIIIPLIGFLDLFLAFSHDGCHTKNEMRTLQILKTECLCVVKQLVCIRYCLPRWTRIWISQNVRDTVDYEDELGGLKKASQWHSHQRRLKTKLTRSTIQHLHNLALEVFTNSLWSKSC